MRETIDAIGSSTIRGRDWTRPDRSDALLDRTSGGIEMATFWAYIFCRTIVNVKEGNG